MIHKNSIPVYLQSKTGESGAVCLAMLLAHFKSFPNLTDVKNAFDGSNDEVPPEHLLAASERFGLVPKLVNITTKEIEQYSPPFIIMTTTGKYALLVKKHRGEFIVNDPELGRRKLSENEFDKIFDGRILVFEPGDNFVVIEKGTSFSQEIGNRARHYKKEIWYVLIAGFILLIPLIIVPTLNKLFFDDIIIAKQTLWYKPMLMIMVAFIVFGCILVFLQQWVLLRTEMKMSLVQSSKFVTHILNVPYTFFQSHTAGDTVKRIMLNDEVATLLSKDLTQLIISLITALFYGIVMIRFNVILTIVGVAVMLSNIIAVNYFSQKRTALNQSLFQKKQRTFSTATVGIEQIETLKASGSENDFFDLWSSYLISTINNDQKLGFTSRLLTVLPDFLSQFNNVIIVILGGLLMIYGQVTIGVFIALQSFISELAAPVKKIVNVSSSVQLNRSNINNLRDTLDEPVDMLCQQESRTSIKEVSPSHARLGGKLEVRNISFGYSKFSAPLIENFSLTAYPGKHIAFVGGSGSGKSTLLKVISGLYTPFDGEILYDGMNINNINRDVLRNSTAMVDQDVFLFTGNIADNITMWNRGIDNDTIIEAAKDAVIHKIISEREDGYQARIAPGGSNFSGGQRQRIEIARALVTNPSIMFLDEATSALDAETEKMVMDSIRRRNCTTITIAHRLSTIRDSDEIIVFERGKVIQRGTHDELVLQKDKLYSRLVSEAS